MSTQRILVVDDEADIRTLLREILSEEGYDVEVAANAAQARSSRAKLSPDLCLLDIWMPDTDGITLLREWSRGQGLDFPVVMMSGHGTVETAVEATRLGAFDFVEKPLSLAKLLRTVERALDIGKHRKQSARAGLPALLAPVGKSRTMLALREQVTQVAPHAAPVMIIGEAGTGREAFARYVHARGARASKPFVSIIAGNLSDATAEIQLRGSETDKDRTPGFYEQAAGGTLFINALDDLSAQAQRLISSDLEAGTYARVGGRQALALDLRVLSSALPGLERRTSPEPFRRDLLSQLNVLTLRIPPLREYAEDVPELLRHYVDRLADAEGLPLRRFSVAAQNRLRNYPWPGNVRELRNLVQRLLILGGTEDITLEEIEREVSMQSTHAEPLVKQDLLAMPLREAREHFERAYLQQQLLLCNGKVGQLAKRVGMERTHLYRKLRALGVDFRNLGDD